MRTLRCPEICLGVAAGIVWVLFSWQYGFMISPDGWFRGVLAKSIVNGTPYWINLNQGYSYDHGVWHHNANHEPLLPVILAGLFALYGPFISFLNLISAFCAGFLLCPLLTLSRLVFGSWFIGLTAYLLVALNLSTEFFKEAMSGLSFPSSILVLLLYLVFSGAVVEQPSWRRVLAAGVCLALYYLSRGEAFGICFFLVVAQFIVAPRAARRVLIQTWLISLVAIAPWAIRKWLLFGDPFFSHATPLLFAEHGNDLWRFPENGFPNLWLFVERNGWTELLTKLFIHNPLSAWDVVQVVSQGWAPYIGLLALAFPVVQYLHEDLGSRRFLAFSLFAAGFGSALLLTQAPILDQRVTLIVSLIALMLALGALERIVRVFIKAPASAQALSGAILLWFGLVNTDAIKLFPREYLRYTFSSEDGRLNSDPSVPALKRRFSQNDVLLAPFAKAQYLNFATGIGMVEIPANFASLNDPRGFLKRFDVSHSLVNLSSNVSSPGWEVFGHTVGHPVLAAVGKERAPTLLEEVLFTVDSAAMTSSVSLADTETSDRSARTGSGVYVDSFHGGKALQQMVRSTLPEAFYGSNRLSMSRAELLQARVLVVGLGGEQNELNVEDRQNLEEFLRNGGSLALFGHVWVWVTQNSQSLSDNPLNQFLRPIGCVLAPEGDVASAPSDPTILPLSLSERSVFSSIICNDSATVLLRTPAQVPIAINGRTVWGGRVLIWAHDEPLTALQNGDTHVRSQLQNLVTQLQDRTLP